jgi:hypothetical protein
VAVAEAMAIAVVLTGPPESFWFDLRLPLLVLAIGALTIAPRRNPLSSVASARHRTGRPLPFCHNGVPYSLLTTDSGLAAEAIEPQPVQMATPWLVLNSTTGIAFLAAKGYENHPALVVGLIASAGVICAGIVCSATPGRCLFRWLSSGATSNSIH